MLIKVKLKDIMKKQRYSIQEVSDETGLHRNTISKIINGKTDGISFLVLEKLCILFNCNIQDIIEYIDDRAIA